MTSPGRPARTVPVITATADAAGSEQTRGEDGSAVDQAASGAGGPRRQGYDGQRVPDQGDGTYLNPIMAGDHPDPTVLRDGSDYYMTFSSFEAFPGLTLWHSTDLVSWTPIGSALPEPLGSVFAVDLCLHEGRYFIYVPVIPTAASARPAGPPEIWVIWTDDIRGPWSEPVALGIEGYIDPGHAVGEDGARHLFLSRGSRVKLTDDGLATDGPVEHVYDGWRYPDDWVVEAYALEGPKIVRRGAWFYMVSAVGGTGGPPTGHMVIVARSTSVQGPWQDCPRNPIIRTKNRSERWWSRGHATLVEGPLGDWWAIYHGYENGFRSLGRQTLLEPIDWTDDGWPVARGGDLSAALPKPLPQGPPQPHGAPVSDDFSTDRVGTHWTFYAPSPQERSRATVTDGSLSLTAKGTAPEDSSPLTCVVGDHAYQITVDVEVDEAAEGGLLLFFDRRLYCGIGVSRNGMTTYRAGVRSHWREQAAAGSRFRLRIENDHHIVTMWYAVDGGPWVRHGLRFDTSGYDASTSVELASLRPALLSIGRGSVTYRNFAYRAMPSTEAAG